MNNKIKSTLLATILSSSVSIYATEIEFWTTDTQDDRIKTIQLIADTFEALHDHKVKIVPVAEEEFATQLSKAAGANSLPNIVHFGAELAGSAGEEGIIDRENTTQIIKDFGADKFYKGALNVLSTTEDGVYNAVPFYGWVQGIWYRADLFERENLNPPETWDDILVAAKHFNNPKEGFYGMLIPSKLDQFAEQVFTQFALSNGAKMFDNEGNLVFNSPQMIETLDFFKELVKYSPPGQQTWRARDYYIQNKMTMFPYSTFIMDDLALAEAAANSLTSENFEDLKGGEFDTELVEKTRMVASIKNTEYASYGQVTGLAVIKDNSNDELKAATAWAQFLLEDENIISWAHSALGGANPAIKSVATSDAYLDDPKGLFERYGKDKMREIISGMEYVNKFSTADGTHPEANIVFAKQIIPQMIQKAIWEDMSSADAIAWAEVEIQKIVDEYRSK